MSGIIDFSVGFPSGRRCVSDLQTSSGLSADDILEITHCHEFPMLAPHEHITDIAVSAARELLARTGTDIQQIGQVIFAGGGCWEKPFWSPASKAAEMLGIRHAHCFEVVNFCNAGMTALKIACDATERGTSKISLVLIADQLSRLVDQNSADAKALFNFGDSAAAMLVTGKAGQFRFAHSAMRTDPDWADYYHGIYQNGQVTIVRPTTRQGLSNAYLENFSNLIDSTLDALDAQISDVSYLLINHGDKNMHQGLLDRLGIPPERSVFNYHRFGHMGGADTLIALQDLRSNDQLKEGDLILLATSAMGFSWGITALEYQS